MSSADEVDSASTPTRVATRVLVLGGYGNFGAVISRKVAAIEGVELLIAGRHLHKAQLFADKYKATAVMVDANSASLADTLRQLGVNIVVNTVGPFQGQGYHVPKACIDAGAHYIDIADAHEFVANISTLEDEAAKNNVLVVAGASSVPALSGAVIDAHLHEFGELHEVRYGITSSELIPGSATVKAVLSYVGKPFRQWRGGHWHTVFGWQRQQRHRFQGDLGVRWMGCCDIADLTLFPKRYAQVRAVEFRAGLGNPITHWSVWVLSWVVRCRLLTSLSALSGVLRFFGRILSLFGSGRSGMFVVMSGCDRQGRALRRTWELVASNNEGVHVPCMAAVALVRKLVAGQLPQRGAGPCLELLSLDDYLAELVGLNVIVHRY